MAQHNKGKTNTLHIVIVQFYTCNIPRYLKSSYKYIYMYGKKIVKLI